MQNPMVYCEVLNNLDPELCPMPPPGVDYADHAIECAKAIGINTYLTGNQIRTSSKLSTLFAAQLFNNNPQQMVANRVVHEEKAAFANYINHLLAGDSVSARYLPLSDENIVEHLCDGVVLFQLLRLFRPSESVRGKVDVNISPSASVPDKLNNVLAVIAIAESLHCDISAVTPREVADARYNNTWSRSELSCSNVDLVYSVENQQCTSPGLY
jgi:hypothetical protein